MTDPGRRARGHLARVTRRVALAIVVVAALVTMRALPLGPMIEALGHGLDALGGAAPVVFGAIYVLATILFVPGSMLTIAAGAFFGLRTGTLVVSIGATVGAACAFLIARHVARRHLERRVAGNPRLAALDAAIGDGGWKIVALLRLSPAIPFNLQNYLYGVTKIRFVPCVLTSWLAMLPGTFMYVYFGHVAGSVVTDRGERSAAEWVALAVGLAATVAVTVYITWLARRRMQERAALAPTAPRDPARRGAPGSARWRTAAAVTAAALMTVVAIYATARRDTIASTVTRWFGPPAVELTEAYVERPGGPAFDHGAFDALLAAHVDGAGWVDYASLERDAARLDRYIASLAAAPFDDLGRNEKLALLINAYNACTLRLVLDHRDDGRLESIRDIPSDERWQHRRWRVAGRTWSLDQIEHEQIRPRFREPRVHFALVCAAVGCPPLRREAYVGARIDEQLADQTRYVHEHATWFQLARDGAVVRLTPLYDWFSGDFEQVAGSVLAYASRSSDTLARLMDDGTPPRIAWLAYDWALNSVDNRTDRTADPP